MKTAISEANSSAWLALMISTAGFRLMGGAHGETRSGRSRRRCRGGVCRQQFLADRRAAGFDSGRAWDRCEARERGGHPCHCPSSGERARGARSQVDHSGSFDLSGGAWGRDCRLGGFRLASRGSHPPGRARQIGRALRPDRRGAAGRDLRFDRRHDEHG
jgi:hypothetical protein